MSQPLSLTFRAFTHEMGAITGQFGHHQDVVKVSDNEPRIRTRQLKQFAAADSAQA